MKLLNMEVMKKIKELETEKSRLMRYESDNSAISYKEGETPEESEYNYGLTRQAIDSLDAEIRRLRYLLGKANFTTKLEGFDMSLAEGLVYLAQLQMKYSRLRDLADYKQKTRQITYNGVLEYTERTYDVKEALAEAKATEQKIAALQMAIDRANLTHKIDV